MLLRASSSCAAFSEALNGDGDDAGDDFKMDDIEQHRWHGKDADDDDDDDGGGDGDEEPFMKRNADGEDDEVAMQDRHRERWSGAADEDANVVGWKED